MARRLERPYLYSARVDALINRLFVTLVVLMGGSLVFIEAWRRVVGK